MRFHRSPRHPFTDTPRKRAALRRRQAKEREALPLLAALVAEAQPSEDAVMEGRAAQWLVSEARARNWRAARWRRARREIAAMEPDRAAAVRAAWNRAPYPADPTYLLDFLHGLRAGRFTLDRLPFDPSNLDLKDA